MSIQDSLSAKQDKLRRHLFDRKILLTGRQYEVLRITKTQFDMYGSALDEALATQGTLTLTVNYPKNIPLDRVKYNTGTEEENKSVASTGTFFFEILPIEIYSQFKDKVETGDYIIHQLADEMGNKIVVILEVTEQLGSFGASLVWRKHLCAPFKGILPDGIQAVIDTLLSEEV